MAPTVLRHHPPVLGNRISEAGDGLEGAGQLVAGIGRIEQHQVEALAFPGEPADGPRCIVAAITTGRVLEASQVLDIPPQCRNQRARCAFDTDEPARPAGDRLDAEHPRAGVEVENRSALQVIQA